MHLLLVEKNVKVGKLVTASLLKAGFDCERVGTIAKGVRAIATRKYAALIVDRDLPDGDGCGLVTKLRSKGDVVPIFLLAKHGDLQDKISALKAGADEYLVEPFSVEELVTRIQVLLRRSNHNTDMLLRIGNVCFDPSNRQLTVDGITRIVSGRQLALLELFLTKPEQILAEQVVEDHLFGQSNCRSNAIEVYVHRLRKSLAAWGASVQVRTIRDVGYILMGSDLVR